MSDREKARRRMWAVLREWGLEEKVLRHVVFELYGECSTKQRTASELERIASYIATWGPDIQNELAMRGAS